MLWSWMNMCFSRCSFLIKGCNWSYLRPGTGLYGWEGEREVRLRWYRAEETGSLYVILSGWRSGLRSSRLDWTVLVCCCTVASERVHWTAVNSSYLCCFHRSLDFTWLFTCYMSIFNFAYKDSTVLWFWSMSIWRDVWFVYVRKRMA